MGCEDCCVCGCRVLRGMGWKRRSPPPSESLSDDEVLSARSGGRVRVALDRLVARDDLDAGALVRDGGTKEAKEEC